jgi:very-short-patch-repair endonuclease
METGATLTRSELEAAFLEFLERTHLPTPEANAHLLINGTWIECDFVWRPQRLVVELDGRATHDTAAAFERDRARDRALAAAGWRTVRVTWRQLRREPESLAGDLRQILVNEKMPWL